jgi:hypothetical protein
MLRRLSKRFLIVVCGVNRKIKKFGFGLGFFLMLRRLCVSDRSVGFLRNLHILRREYKC